MEIATALTRQQVKAFAWFLGIEAEHAIVLPCAPLHDKPPPLDPYLNRKPNPRRPLRDKDKNCKPIRRALAVEKFFITFANVQLEDHLGDIVRKAAAANNLSRTAAATAAGLSEKEFTAFGESGRSSKKINLSALAKLTGLNPTKLQGIADGWLPAPEDLSRWRELRIVTTESEGLTVHCYLVWDAATRTAALFDTGLDARPVLDLIAAEGLMLQHIFITHSHWDHIEALTPIRAAWPQAQLHSGSKNAPVAQRNQPDEIIPLGRLRVTHRDTPGHADDGVTYLIGNWSADAPAVAIVGDTILAGSMCNGNGEWELAKQKIREHILSLPAETLLCPGHGPLTTVAEEKAHNPFF